MYAELLKEVLMPFNAKEVEYFDEATKSCTDEQRLAVAKLMSEAKPPEGWQFTAAQIKRFVAQDSLSKVNWYPGIRTNNSPPPICESDSSTDAQQAKAYRALSDRLMADACGFTPEQRKKLGIEESSDKVDKEGTLYKQLRQLQFSKADAKKLIRSGFKF